MYTRTDLDCRVVATSRCVAPTECDSKLPLFGRGSTCRLRLLDSWSPARAEAVVFWARRAARLARHTSRLDSCVATCRPDRVRLVRHTSHVRGGPTRPTRPTLSDSVGRRCHGTRDSSDMPPLESPPDSDQNARSLTSRRVGRTFEGGGAHRTSRAVAERRLAIFNKIV